MGPAVTPRHHVVIGGGIVGLATAREIQRRHPDDRVSVLEKERRWAAHQTGHNSGVIHAGVYYRPGSLKATMCRAGNASMVRFCRQYGLDVRVCGKLLVAVDRGELPRLRTLVERGLAGGLPIRMISPAEARQREPHVACVAAAYVASTGIVDFAAVCDTLATLLADAGAELHLGEEVIGVRPVTGAVVVTTTAGELVADTLVNCAGLHADRVARLAGVELPARILPFRGEYYELRPQRRDLVRGLIYPVPDPSLPFLGVHLTRMIDGAVHAGPNAVLALAREGYGWRRFDARDVLDAASYPGMWRLARRQLRQGVEEVRRSLSRRRFAASVARLVPEVTADDLLPAGAGVRAQAVAPTGELVDDFLVVRRERQVHVINAPSPAATSAFEIASHIVDRFPT
jgi:L-2-hydroxyglutarate oxidase